MRRSFLVTSDVTKVRAMLIINNFLLQNKFIPFQSDLAILDVAVKIFIMIINNHSLIITSYVSVGPPYTLRLRVKFYSSEPNCLREELTRYQFFLQLKLDILEGRLECQDNTAVELAALALQCKL